MSRRRGREERREKRLWLFSSRTSPHALSLGPTVAARVERISPAKRTRPPLGWVPSLLSHATAHLRSSAVWDSGFLMHSSRLRHSPCRLLSGARRLEPRMETGWGSALCKKISPGVAGLSGQKKRGRRAESAAGLWPKRSSVRRPFLISFDTQGHRPLGSANRRCVPRSFRIARDCGLLCDI